MSPYHYPLASINSWAPFRLDALGLVTLLGADEVARNIGSLTRNTFTDWMPIIGAYKVAANQFATEEAGFALYNITDGVWTTELNGWITRWLSSNLDYKHTILQMTVNEEPRRFCPRAWMAAIIGCILNWCLVTLAVLQKDWYGFANAAAMFLGVLVRNILLESNRDFLNTSIQTKFVELVDSERVKAFSLRTLIRPAQMATLLRNNNGGLLEAKNKSDAKLAMVKLIVVLPDGKLAIIRTHRGLVPFLLNPLQAQSHTWRQFFYRSARAVGWVSFAVHVVAIGQATLLTQLVTVALMGISTLMAVFRLGCFKDHEVGTWLNIRQTRIHGMKYDNSQKGWTLSEDATRQDAYVRLVSDDQLELQYMQDWSLFPQKDSTFGKTFLAEFAKKRTLFKQSREDWLQQDQEINARHESDQSFKPAGGDISVQPLQGKQEEVFVVSKGASKLSTEHAYLSQDPNYRERTEISGKKDV